MRSGVDFDLNGHLLIVFIIYVPIHMRIGFLNYIENPMNIIHTNSSFQQFLSLFIDWFNNKLNDQQFLNRISMCTRFRWDDNRLFAVHVNILYESVYSNIASMIRSNSINTIQAKQLFGKQIMGHTKEQQKWIYLIFPIFPVTLHLPGRKLHQH